VRRDRDAQTRGHELLCRTCSHPTTRLPDTRATQLRPAAHHLYRRARATVKPALAGRAAPCCPTTRLPGTRATLLRPAMHPLYRRARAPVGLAPAGRAAPCSHPTMRLLLGTRATQLRPATHPF